MGAGRRDDGAVGEEFGAFAGILGLELGVHLAADNQDIQADAKLAGQSVGINGCLGFGGPTNAEFRAFELDQKMAIFNVGCEEKVGAVGGVLGFVDFIGEVFYNGLELAVARHEAVFIAEDPEIVL